MNLSPARTGLALGGAVGLWHVLWSGLVAMGWAKPVFDFLLWLHFLQMPVTFQPFDAVRAAMLVAVTFTLAFAMGAVFAGLWNWLHREPQTTTGGARADQRPGASRL